MDWAPPGPASAMAGCSPGAGLPGHPHSPHPSQVHIQTEHWALPGPLRGSGWAHRHRLSPGLTVPGLRECWAAGPGSPLEQPLACPAAGWRPPHFLLAQGSAAWEQRVDCASFSARGLRHPSLAAALAGPQALPRSQHLQTQPASTLGSPFPSIPCLGLCILHPRHLALMPTSSWPFLESDFWGLCPQEREWLQPMHATCSAWQTSGKPWTPQCALCEHHDCAYCMSATVYNDTACQLHKLPLGGTQAYHPLPAQ